MKHRSSLLAVCSALLITAGLLAGCNAGSGKETTASETEAATTTETTKESTTETESESAKETTTEAAAETEPESEAATADLSLYTAPFVATSDALNIYAEANDTSTVVGTLEIYGGGEVLETTEDGAWLHVQSGAVNGYLSASLAATGADAAAFAAGHTVSRILITEAVVNIREGASTSTTVLGSAYSGQTYDLTGDQDGFYKISYNGGEAFISMTCATAGNYLKEAVSTLPETVEETTTAAAAVAPASGSAAQTTAGSNGYTVCIDPGHQAHGISDLEPNAPGSSVMKAKLTTGTAGCVTGNAEYEINLEVSLKLQAELTARGYSVVMIRTTNDCPMSNAERAQVANASGADIFVRVHCNSLDNSSVTGIINYAPSAANPYLTADVIQKSNTLAAVMADKMCAATGAVNRGVLQDDTMTGINWCTIPVTIVEMGFMSNPTEDQLLADQGYQQKLATGMADGIDAYFGR